jgi:hypothetical protein
LENLGGGGGGGDDDDDEDDDDDVDVIGLEKVLEYKSFSHRESRLL